MSRDSRPAMSLDGLREILVRRKDKLAAVLGGGEPAADRLIQMAVAAAFKQPNILACEPGTVLTAVQQVAELGLDLSEKLGECRLQPRWNGKAQRSECSCEPGYQGWLKLARSSGIVADIDAKEVYESDEFTWKTKNGRLLYEHTPDLDAPRTDARIRYFYAVAVLQGGVLKGEVMTRSQVDAIRDRGDAGANGPWKTDYNMMGRKTVIKRLCKLLPRSPQMSRAVELLERDGSEEPTEEPAATIAAD